MSMALFGIIANISALLLAQYCTRKLLSEFFELPDHQSTELTSRTAPTTTTATITTTAAANNNTTTTTTTDDISYFKRNFQFAMLIIPILVIFAFSLMIFFTWFIDMMIHLFVPQSTFLGLTASIE
ncbi:hypothetical protein DiNV_CH01M_ORF30 [Drosophila innubila nudivirus]|uniref:Uncharacterized protein n=1 Tax=Drosophila innubila nudivirus TaxID=2057187 RepID=A0A2H4UX64_9VIRU|nr:hypothetical protein DiNV_CH01M_ORF30 [Drosophila innubila nudivirus]ATZ81512.1 hypothetical protein DiNV_CH01M_ORF30 [Drosophila innubila nudivirus]